MSDRIVKNYRGNPWAREHILDYVGVGWHGIVTKLIEDLFDAGWDGQLHQIKEKFGGLRFYTAGLTEEQSALVCAAERESGRTCETCGEPGTRDSTGGYLLTLCENHARQRKEKQAEQAKR